MQAHSTLEHRGLKPVEQLAAGRPHGDRLRYMAGCRCDACRAANTAYERERAAARKAGDWNGFVCAGRARAHMLALAAKGVGRRSIGAVTDVADTTLYQIRNGDRTTIRARTERAILAVTPEMAADGATVPAGPTWKLVGELVRAGFTKKRIAGELGQQGRGLQLGRERVTVRNAHQVKRLHERLMRSDEALIAAGPTWRRIQALRDEWFSEPRIARELGWADGVLRIGKRLVTRALADQVEQTYRRLTT